MTGRFITTKEVAALLRISSRTLYNYASQHEIYRPSRPGIWHVEHVRILENIWAGVISEDEGLALWRYRKLTMRESIKSTGNMVEKKKSKNGTDKCHVITSHKGKSDKEIKLVSGKTRKSRAG